MTSEGNVKFSIIVFNNMNIKDIVVKKEYFPRINLNEETIARYQEIYELGESLPPIIVQKEKKILIDGFHRLEAQKRLGYEDVDVHLMDIPEDAIYLKSIELNRQHGLPFSREDRNTQIRKLRFETTPPLTYEEIGKAVVLSTSRVGEICRDMEFNINGTINAKVDLRSNLTPQENEEIQDRVEAGESTSKIAQDYPVGDSRISQKKKSPRKPKPKMIKKQKTLSQMPIQWTRRSLEKRFRANNPRADWQEIDFDANLNIHDEEFYHDLVESFRKIYPQYEWYYPKERPPFNQYYNISPEEVYHTSIDIALKLVWTHDKKYAHVKGTIPKNILDYVRDRLEKEFTIEWPLIEVEDPDRYVFPKLSDEDLTELYGKAQEQYQEPEDEDDEEMKKFKNLLPEE